MAVQSASRDTTSLSRYTASCTKCQQVMVHGVKFKDLLWHRECFTCSNCPTRLAGTKFTSQDGQPYCFRCYGHLFAHKCKACSNPIFNIGDGFMIYMSGDYWHVGCFVCVQCKTHLLGELSVTKSSAIYCTKCSTATV